MTAGAMQAKHIYIDTEHMAKHAVWQAKSEKFATVSTDGDDVFRITTYTRSKPDAVGYLTASSRW